MGIFSASKLNKFILSSFIILYLFSASFNILSAQSASPETDKLQQLYSQLLANMQEGKYGNVISGCKDIIEKDHSFCQAYELLVQASAKKQKKSISNNELGEIIYFFQRLLKNESSNFYYYYGLGLCYKKKKNYLKAIENLEKSIKLGADFWEVYEELIPYYKHKKDLKNAIDIFSENINHYPENSFLYQGLGYIYFFLSEYKQSLSCMEKALVKQKKSKYRQAEEKCLYYLAYLYLYRNDYSKASECLEQSINISRETGNRHDEANSLGLISFIHMVFGNYDNALKLSKYAFNISKEINKKKTENFCLRVLGIIHLERGNLSEARKCLDTSLKYSQDIDDIRGLNICFYWMTILYQITGDYSKALEYAERALRISQELGNKSYEALFLSLKGEIYLSLGNYTKALKFNKQALNISEKFIAKWTRENCLNTIGNVYIEMTNYQGALNYFEQALKYIQKTGHNREKAKCLYNIGCAYFKMENYQEALCYFLMSLKDAELQGKKSIEGYNYNRLGDLYYKQEDFHKSEQCYYNALSFGHKIGHPDIIWEAHSGLGLIYTSQKQFSRAVKQYKKAIDVIEDLRSHILIREHSSGFFKSKIHIYGQLVNLYFDLHAIDPSKGYDKECFYYVEKAKARVFLDDLREIKPDFKTILTSQERQNEIESLSKMISYIMTRLNSSSLDRSEKAELLNKLEKAEDNIQIAIEIAKKENPDYIKSFHNEPLRVDKVQNKLLNKKTMLVEYFAGEKNLFIFFITQDNLSIFRLPYDVSESTQELVENYVKLLSSKDISDSDCKFVGRSLYERLFLPRKNKLRADIKNLIIIPDRYLYYLPFEMLSHKESGIKNEFIFLVEDYNISYAPSASTLISILHKEKKAGNQKDLLVIGDPVYNSGKEQIDEAIDSDDILYDYYQKRFDIHPLSFAIEEVKSISSLIKNGSKLIICQEKATEENVKKLPLIEYKIIHFATHSLLDEKVAKRSALVLTLDDDPAEDGFFQVREIYNEKLDSDLVVLSACQTARGKIEKGEGIQGLPRAFFYAGAKSVLSSLWNINDRSTAEFMKHFYKYLSHGKTKQEALRLTKIKMLHSKYNHPYYWAAFILTGDSDSIISLSKKPLWERLLVF